MTDATVAVPAQDPGIQEFVNIITSVLHLVQEIGMLTSDGVQAEDAISLLQNFATDPVYLAAVKGYKDLVPEAKALDATKAIGLAVQAAMAIPGLIAAFKKKA